MPSWGEILQELSTSAVASGGQPDFDGIRRKYLTQLHALTGRDTIVYATDWLRGATPMSSIDLGDMQGMMEVCQGLQGPGLDLILHSPGGSAEATASIVRYLRRKFPYDIRFFVPLAAISAATMWALAANLVVMGKHSQLGPIDPQLITPVGVISRSLILRPTRTSKTPSSASTMPSPHLEWLRCEDHREPRWPRFRPADECGRCHARPKPDDYSIPHARETARAAVASGCLAAVETAHAGARRFRRERLRGIWHWHGKTPCTYYVMRRNESSSARGYESTDRGRY